MGEKTKEALRLQFDKRLRLEFQGEVLAVLGVRSTQGACWREGFGYTAPDKDGSVGREGSEGASTAAWQMDIIMTKANEG